MGVLKRVKPKDLRQSIPEGRCDIIVYEEAGIDFGFWTRCCHKCSL